MLIAYQLVGHFASIPLFMFSAIWLQVTKISRFFIQYQDKYRAHPRKRLVYGIMGLIILFPYAVIDIALIFVSAVIIIPFFLLGKGLLIINHKLSLCCYEVYKQLPPKGTTRVKPLPDLPFLALIGLMVITAGFILTLVN